MSFIEIKLNDKHIFLNMEKVTQVRLMKDKFEIFIDATYTIASFQFVNASEFKAFYHGLLLALDGIDCIFDSGDESGLTGYIKPLLSTKTEKMYDFIRLKEILGDRNGI